MLNLYRKFAKDNGLAKLTITQFATSFLTLSCIVNTKKPLISMLALEAQGNRRHT